MKKTAQVIFALVMAAAILVSCAGGGKAGPDTAGGGGAGTQPGSVTENGGGESSPSGGLGAIGSAKPGETVYFGSWDQDGKDGGEPISWIVLYQGVGRTLVLSEKVLEYDYFKSPTDEDKFPRCLYKDSDLRAFLNGGFFDGAFSGDEKAAVPAVKITTGYKDESYRELTYETEDRVFLLSVEEAARYVCGVGTADLGVATERVGTDNPYGSSSISGVQGIDKAMTWWLRDMGVDNSKTARVVLADTNHRKNHDRNVYDKAGVRPAMWIVYNEKDAKAYENGEISPAEDASLNARISALKTGDRLQLGKYDKNPYNMDGYEDMFWTVVEEDDVSFLLMSCDQAGSMVFAEKTAEGYRPETASWADSSLRRVINGAAFLDMMFSPQEKAKLVTSHISSSGEDGRTGGDETDDILFAPDVKDLEKYGSIAGAGIGSKYWLRSQASWEPYIAYTDSKGEAGSKDPTESCGVRLMVRISKR